MAMPPIPSLTFSSTDIETSDNDAFSHAIFGDTVINKGVESWLVIVIIVAVLLIAFLAFKLWG